MKNMKALPNQISSLLDELRVASLCTVDPKGELTLTPTPFVFNKISQTIFFIISKDSQNFKNITCNPQASFTVDRRDPVNPFKNRGVMVEGRATVRKDLIPIKTMMSPAALEIYRLFEKRYTNLSEVLFRNTSKGSSSATSEMRFVELRPVKMVYWEGPHFKVIKFPKP